MNTSIEPQLLKLIKSLVAEKIGLVVRSEDEKRFCEVILSRVKRHKLSEPNDYYLALKSNTCISDQEWRKLVSLLTVGESYFFRDKGQFKVLREHILPELISRRKAAHSLNIWSAGCSTGEEAYSIAMVIDELLPDRKNGRIVIRGTDINEEAIEKARKGVFPKWSFRGVDQDIQRKYFRRHKDGLQIIDETREMVEFRFGNLLDTPTDIETEFGLMDLIMCRNVFIYFNAETIERVISRFTGLLNEEGYLMTGHGELFEQGNKISHLTIKALPESVFYQKTSKGPPLKCYSDLSEQERRKINPENRPSKPVSDHKTPKKSVPQIEKKLDSKKIEPITADAHSELDRIFLLGDYVSVIKIGEEIVRNKPNDLRTLQLLANACANMGLHEKAEEKCRRIIETDSASVNAYFLLATIAEARGDIEQAKDLLKKVIYLDHQFVAAYLELSGLYDRESDRRRASKMRRTALELLEAKSPDTLIEPYKEITAGELIKHIIEKL